MYGFDIWKKSNYIFKEALLKFALSTTNSKKDAARFLGLTYAEFRRVVSTYKVDNFFSDDIWNSKPFGVKLLISNVSSIPIMSYLTNEVKSN